MKHQEYNYTSKHLASGKGWFDPEGNKVIIDKDLTSIIKRCYFYNSIVFLFYLFCIYQ